MSEIISSKNGRLHIYVRQDKYKGKLKSENWVGRTFHNGRQKVISSGTTNLEEAKVILEKWYDDLISGSIPENAEKKQNDTLNPDVDNVPTQTTTQAQSEPEATKAQSEQPVEQIEEKQKPLTFRKKQYSKSKTSLNKLRDL